MSSDGQNVYVLTLGVILTFAQIIGNQSITILAMASKSVKIRKIERGGACENDPKDACC